MFNPLRVFLRSGWIAVLLLTLSVGGTLAQGNRNLPAFVNGEAVITVPAGTPRATVDAIAAKVNARVVYAFGSIDFERTIECYHLRVNVAEDAAATAATIANLKADNRIRGAWTNNYVPYLQTPTATPNDPRYNEQWDKVMLNMPKAWGFEKGKSNAVITVVDDGCDITHPEFPANRVFKPFNVLTGAPDSTPGVKGDDHGTHVSGIAAAQADNGIGVAGIAWDNVLLMPIRSGTGGGSLLTDLVKSLQYVLDQKNANPDKKFVMNISLGLPSTSVIPDLGNLNPFEQMVLTVAKAGIVVCIAAGNDFNGDQPVGPLNPPFTPAYLAGVNDNIVCVTSVGITGVRAIYSEVQPYTTVAAPGGDPSVGKTILSTFPVIDGSYAYDQGTSMAAPQVAGVVGLMLSLPGVQAADIKPALMATAKLIGGATGKTPEYGAGLVDAYAALLKVAISVNVVTPDGSGGNNATKPGTPLPVETLRPPILIHVNQITPDKLTITVDGTTIPQGTVGGSTPPFYVIQNVTKTVTDNLGNTVPSVYDALINNLDLSPGQHTVVVVGIHPSAPTDITVTDTRNFLIQPHVLAAGRSMISFPYFESEGATPGSLLTPQTYLGADFQIARWVPAQDRYAFFSSFGVGDAYATFTPPDVSTHQDGDSIPRTLIGLGYWLDAGSIKPILTHGKALTDRPFIIPLIGNGSGSTTFISWNMVGDPFPFNVPFSSMLVDTPGGRISITEAVTRGLILPNIFSYDSTNGYTYRTLPDGALMAWQSHWIGVTSSSNIALVVPPANSQTRSAVIGAPDPNTVGGWTLRLSAHTKDLHDTYNFIGVSTRAADGYGREDVPKPPISSPYVTLGISHTDWGKQSGTFASDIRTVGGVKSWTVVVNSDQANANVTVNWAGRTLPRNQKLTIKDETTGQVSDMRTRSSVSFNTGASTGTRKFTITAKTGIVVPLTLRDVSVAAPSRAPGSRIGFTMSTDATYDVKVLTGAGAPVTTVATRAAGAGTVSLYWDGRDASGKNVASGSYLVQVRASTTDGESVKVVRPFFVVR